MSEDDIRNYLAGKTKAAPPVKAIAPRVRRRPPQARAPEAPDTFKDFSATHLLCPTCKRAMPVRQKILLFLPDGDLYDYTCTTCGTSCGTRKAGK